MTTPRSQLVDPNTPLCYHLVSRCVRKAWLCGFDRIAKRDYSHRKEWLLARLNQLGEAFAIDVYAYAIMSNHFHLVVYYDPTAAQHWTDIEVAERWLTVCPPKSKDGQVDDELRQLYLGAILREPGRVNVLRRKLGSLSLFMKLLKQPIARRANLEDDCTGHFFEKRFYSAALLTNEAVLAAMAYVDLNPIRAKIAENIAGCEFTSIAARLNSAQLSCPVNSYLHPVIEGLAARMEVRSFTLVTYVHRLEALYSHTSQESKDHKYDKWRNQVAALQKKQRVFGSLSQIKSWLSARGLKLRETPLS